DHVRRRDDRLHAPRDRGDHTPPPHPGAVERGARSAAGGHQQGDPRHHGPGAAGGGGDGRVQQRRHAEGRDDPAGGRDREADAGMGLVLGRIGPLHLHHEWLLAKLDEGLVDVQGHKMLLDPIDTLGLSVRDVWEPLETKVVQNEVRRGSVVLDIGAHIGYYTLLMARLVGPQGRVFAFEPNPANYDLLRRNIQINSYRNVTAVN